MNDYEKIEFRKETENIKDLLGKLEKPKQIAKAVHYEASLRNSAQDKIKRQVLSKYIQTAGNGLHARLEMQVYRMMGETSKYLTRDQALDLDTLKQLVAVLEFWAFLAMAGELIPFLEHGDIKRVYTSGGSAAEVFRAFLDVQKAKAKSDKWTQEHMNEVLFTVHEAVENFQKDGEPLLSQRPPPKKAKSEKPSKPSKPRSQTEQAQANSVKTPADRHAQEPPAKRARIEEIPSNQYDQNPFETEDRGILSSKVLQSLSDYGTKPTVYNAQKPLISSQNQLPQTPAAYESKGDSTKKISIHSLLNLSDPAHKVFLFPTQPIATSSAEKDDFSRKPQPLQPAKSQTPAGKSTGDIWEVSDDESDDPKAEADKEEKAAEPANSKSKGINNQVQPTFSSAEVDLPKPETRSDPLLSSTEKIDSADHTPHEGTPLQRFSAKITKVEASIKAAEKIHAEAKATLETAKANAAEANKSLEGFDTNTRNELDGILTLDRKPDENWTYNAIRSQAEAFQKFGFDKRRQLLAVQVPIGEEEQARKKFEEAKAENEKWVKKMDLLNQAAAAFDED